MLNMVLNDLNSAQLFEAESNSIHINLVISYLKLHRKRH
jgi:hypothetical protein